MTSYYQSEDSFYKFDSTLSEITIVTDSGDTVAHSKLTESVALDMSKTIYYDKKYNDKPNYKILNANIFHEKLKQVKTQLA